MNLKTLEVSDMCDVIHALYEEDAIELFEGHAKIKSQVRVTMWKQLYEKDYAYPWRDPESGMLENGLPPEDSLLPEEAAPKPLKPYIPPTEFEQFKESGLDAPMGGEMF